MLAGIALWSPFPQFICHLEIHFRINDILAELRIYLLITIQDSPSGSRVIRDMIFAAILFI
jgi:hypothetical protein